VAVDVAIEEPGTAGLAQRVPGREDGPSPKSNAQQHVDEQVDIQPRAGVAGDESLSRKPHDGWFITAISAAELGWLAALASLVVWLVR
jgi:hypothetical protein